MTAPNVTPETYNRGAVPLLGASVPDWSRSTAAYLAKELSNIQRAVPSGWAWAPLATETGVKDLKYYYGNVRRYGAVGDGSTDDTAAFQAAIDFGYPVFVPVGTYRITESLIFATKFHMVGAGVDQTTIQSYIVGDSLFRTEGNDGVSFLYVAHMRLNGNNTIGAGGSGHCFNFIDPQPLNGSATPQVSRLEHLWIDGFRGEDDADEAGIIKINSAAVMQYGTLGITCERVYVSDGGHGFYLRRTQNCRIIDCLATDIQKAAVFAYDNENLVIDCSDLIDSGQSGGTTDPGYPDGGADPDLAGVFVAVGNNNLVLSNTKLKGFQGKALIVIKSDGLIADPQNIVISGNWIRGDAQIDIPHKAIYAERVAGLIIRNNLFSPSNTGFSATQKYETIELHTPSSVPAFESTIEGNVFDDTSGFDTAYNIKIVGNASVRSHRTTIRNNRFGSNSSRSAAMVADADILIDTCLLTSSDISNNSFYAPTNVTRTACITMTGAALDDLKIGPNLFQTGGGAITANYSGITESVLRADLAAVDPISLADGAGETFTVTVTGAELGDFAEASFSNSLQSMMLPAYVSAANTVQARLQNETGGVLDLASGTLRVRVTKTWAV